MITFPIAKKNLMMVKESRFFTQNRRFLRFQMTALFATTIDFLMTILFESYIGFHYSLAVALGATCGGLSAFLLNRSWVFASFGTHPVRQATKYLFVVAGSIILNTAGTYLLTESTMLTYLISKAIVAMILGFTYSYYFSKRFVFYA